MKKYIFTLITLAICVFYSCDEEESKRPEGGVWNVGPVEDYTITPINGGATITYDISNDPEILYIMAEYERNGRIFTDKSSVHKNYLTIEGFHRVNKVKATLYKVNKLEQRSAPLEVEFEPLESLIDIAQRTWHMEPGFGGIVSNWENPAMTELGVRLMVENEDQELETFDVHFNTSKIGKQTFRPLEPVETNFAISFEDKWGNISDTVRFTTTPLFEIMIPKSGYRDFRSNIPYDNTTNYSGRNLGMLWDNTVNTSSHGWLTTSGSSGLSITIDLGQVAKLSRIVRHPYHVNALYGQANITDYEVWGTNKIDYDLLEDKSYWLDSLSVRWGAIHGVDRLTELPERTFKDDWVYLGKSSVPAGLSTAEANALAASGVELEVPFEARPVRYVRLFVRGITMISPPPTNNYFSCSEITFYGDTSVPQD